MTSCFWSLKAQTISCKSYYRTQCHWIMVRSLQQTSQILFGYWLSLITRSTRPTMWCGAETHIQMHGLWFYRHNPWWVWRGLWHHSGKTHHYSFSGKRRTFTVSIAHLLNSLVISKRYPHPGKVWLRMKALYATCFLLTIRSQRHTLLKPWNV